MKPHHVKRLLHVALEAEIEDCARQARKHSGPDDVAYRVRLRRDADSCRDIIRALNETPPSRLAACLPAWLLDTEEGMP